MVSIAAYFEDNDCKTFSHIIKISYAGSGGRVEVAEEGLLTHYFPIDGPLWFHANNGVFIVQGSALRFLEIKKE